MNDYIDPELKYCPRCGDEYRADIVTCASCEVELLTGARLTEIMEQERQRRENRNRAIDPGEDLVDIRNGSLLEVKQVQILLERESIPTLIVGEGDPSCGKGCCGGSKVILRARAADLQDIREVLTRDYIKSTGLEDHDLSHASAIYDEDAAQTTCPACGHVFFGGSGTCPDCGLCFA